MPGVGVGRTGGMASSAGLITLSGGWCLLTGVVFCVAGEVVACGAV